MNRDQLLAESRKLPRQERARFVLDLVRDLEDDSENAVAGDEASAAEVGRRGPSA